MNKYLYIASLSLLELFILFTLGSKSCDYENYRILINDIYPNLDFIGFISHDPLFSYSTISLKNLGFKFEYIMFFISSFSVLIKNSIFLKLKTCKIISLLYFVSLFWMHEVIQVRASLATTFIMLAWLYFFSRKKYPYFFSGLAAVSAHMSSLVFSIFNIISFKNSKRVIFSIIILVFIVTMAPYLYNIDRIARYNSDELKTERLGILTILNFIAIYQIIIFFMKKNFYLSNKFIQYFIPAPFLVFVFLFLGRNIPVLSIRPSQLLLLPMLVIMSEQIYSQKKDIKIISFLIWLPLLFYAFPYKNFFI